jgi:glutathione S-transferase
MRRLYHLWLSPASRAVRVLLAEKGLEFDLQVEPVWERRDAFLSMSPTGDVPVLVEPEGEILSDGTAICEYLEEAYPDTCLIPGTALERAEIRRITSWFHTRFQREVTRNLVDEKVMKRFMGMGEPNTNAIRVGHHNVAYHMEYISYLAERRFWLAGEEFSLADIVAATQLSCLDYLGDIPWDDYEQAKNWYARIKSRPSFRPLLNDRIGGMKPAKHYHDPDF